MTCPTVYTITSSNKSGKLLCTMTWNACALYPQPNKWQACLIISGLQSKRLSSTFLSNTSDKFLGTHAYSGAFN